jgi:hypothetical protein
MSKAKNVSQPERLPASKGKKTGHEQYVGILGCREHCADGVHRMALKSLCHRPVHCLRASRSTSHRLKSVAFRFPPALFF